ncbi:MAG: pyridoxal phosphate-dependent aminotransferase family protein [Dehalobacterium sp.]
MVLSEFYHRFKLDQSLLDETGFNPYYRGIQSGLSDSVIVEGERFINLASNNYLGLAMDDRVKAFAIKVLDKYGTSLCGTPIATGYIDLFKAVEERLAKFIGLEASIILPSCYQANNGLFSAIAGKDDLIVMDHYAHSSLVQGARTAGCRIRPFLHNNMDHLSSILEKSFKYHQIFIVTESVFSTDGSIAPLKEIVQLAEKFHAVPVVDDSHGIGTIGKKGRGILAEAGITDFPGIYTASLGKALANSGGMISGKKDLIDYLRYYCPHLVYSTAISPAVLGGIAKVLDIIEEEYEEIKARMWRYKNLLSQGLLYNNFKLSDGKAPIISICTGSSSDTIDLAKRFYENKVLTTPFIAPSVPVSEGKVRLIAGGNLKEETIYQVLEIIKKIGHGQ